MKLTLTRKAKLASLVAACGLIAPLFSAPVDADPRQVSSSLATVGSDTTQEVVNAFQGESAGIFYTPLATDGATGRTVLSSWEAKAPSGTSGNTIACVQTKLGGATFTRPNGSSAGRRALSRAMSNESYGDASCGGAKPVSGLVDVARSSDGPANGDAGTDLTYIPFARDGLSFAYYAVNGATANVSLSRQNLALIFDSSGTGLTVEGLLTIPCQIQSGSGTRRSWATTIGVAEAEIDTAGTTCRNAGVVGDLQESKPSELKAKGDAWAAANPGQPAMFVVGHSASAFIAQNRGAAPSFLGAGVDLGDIDDNGSGADLGRPYTGTGASMQAAPAFYNDATFGRFVYNVVSTARITSALGNLALKQMFRGPASQVCTAGAARITNFGFLTLPLGAENLTGQCGSIALTGSKLSGTI